MNEEELYSREKDLKRLSSAWSVSRALAGKSQEYMAMEMGVTRKTIQNWEKGVSAPDFPQSIRWFKVLGISPLPYLFQYIFPSMENISGADSDEKIREALLILLNELPIDSVRQLLYLFYGDHGSSPKAILNLMNAHLQCPMKDRVIQAGVVIRNYELANSKGNITDETHIKPDLDLLKKALAEGEKAFLNDDRAYVLNK